MYLIKYLTFYKISIKLLFIFIIVYIFNLNKKIIYIDNDNQFPEFENNTDFSNFNSDIKIIALYLPQFHTIYENDVWWGKGFTEWTNVKKFKPFFKGHHQPRIPGDTINYLGYYKLNDVKTIKKQVELAKSHGIYGFGIYYYWFSGKRLLEKPLDIFLNNKDIKFPFLLIWANENWTRKWDGKNDDILIKQEYKEKDPENFIKDIKKYLIDQRYIKIKKKPVLGLYEPSKVPKLKYTINIWREKSKELGIGEIFILICLNDNKTEDFSNSTLFDAAYDFPPRNGLGNIKVKFKNSFIYSELIYKNIQFNYNNNNDFPIYRGSMLEWDNCPRVNICGIFDYYSPEQFYIINKIIIEWTKKNYNKENRFIFINAWNEWGEGSYLEPDKKYGYNSINSLSKALFNLSYIKINNLKNLTNKIAIQAHVFYEDLIDQIIEKTNTIPIKFDLFISTDSKIKKKIIENHIKNNSNANIYQIKIFPNKGRDILPLLLQLRKKIKNYKYFCHIHTKKSFHTNIGDEWRNYNYNNLLGNKVIISEILSDFENNEKLGLIFPETYYKILNLFGKDINDNNLKYMNFIIKKINSNIRISPNYFDYPAGNMFWAKVKAVYQIFELNLKTIFPEEKGQIDSTLMHGIERVWVYIAKLNEYYYKKIFKHI